MTLLILSQLIGSSILDTHKEKVATLKDVVVCINPQNGTTEERYPPLAGLLAHTHGREFWIPATLVETIDKKGIALSSTTVNLERYVRRDGEILLGQDVMDKQLVDMEGRRVIRVNDLALGYLAGSKEVRLLAVDISFHALSRRILSWSRLHLHDHSDGTPLSQRERLLDWADVQYFASNAPAVKLHVSHERLSKLHPADLARLLDDLSHQQREEIVHALDNETVADALEEMEPDEAADILEEIAEERASDILEEMEPDAAADIVADLSDEKAETLLGLMEAEESADVRELLSYPADSAGGLMTNDFLLLQPHLGVAEALRSIREHEEQPEFVDYLYIAEAETDRLLGVASLRNVVFHPDRSIQLEQIMEHDIISVHPLTPDREAAALLTSYGLRALPVVDEAGVILGIITFDDALDILLPDELRERVEHIFSYRRKRIIHQ